MSLRRRRAAVVFRLAIVISVLAGIVLTALGSATLTGLLPYFTIQSNLAVGLFAGYAAWLARQDRPEPPSALKGAVTLYITITGVVYHLVLANPASPFAMPQADRTLGEALGNQFLHTVVPLLAVADWALFDRRGRLRPRYAAWWLAFPLGYLGFALLRGLVVDKYPYPFIDAGELGYAGVAVSAVFFAAAFWLLGLLFVAVDRGLGRRAGAPAAPSTSPDAHSITPDAPSMAPDAPSMAPDAARPDATALP
ncbi:Pr6Pr family membrane protein [Micromonospora sp. DSM 115977]|uniref:Pr6Pr family membrane protein n=1 Tax=Micromonospora reichwaldensis TaxID=3075516 RepID=A0ABU2WTG0_9ACTN|nr:Pr6Pr family membrane protein [Micromonospora sp. DSM 115977]MDT0529215.1 Pr6Pr family membrane protein [Micromonospora sp. DSM 115977]